VYLFLEILYKYKRILAYDISKQCQIHRNFAQGPICSAGRPKVIPGVSKSYNYQGQMRTCKETEGRNMTLTQQWRYLNLTRNSFLHLIYCKRYRELQANYI